MISTCKRVKRYTHFIGIDVSKNEVDFAIMNEKNLLFHEEVKNDITEIIPFIVRLKSMPKFSIAKSLFCMESTGIYCNHLLYCFKLFKANIVVENPIHIKKSLGLVRDKNDKADAIRIAQYALKNKDALRLWVPKRQVIFDLANLAAIRSRLLSTQIALKTPIKELNMFVNEEVIQRSEAMCHNSLLALKNDLKNVDDNIQLLILADPRLKRLHEIITSVPNIGEKTALQLIISTNEFKDIKDPKKFACYAGVAPFIQESGIFKGKAKISHIANKKIKTLLHICAVSSLRKGELKDYYTRKVAEGKSKMGVINAIRNKLILRIFACVNQDRLYQDQYNREMQSLQSITMA